MSGVLKKPRALRPGDRLARRRRRPAGFDRAEFDAGVDELRRARLRAEWDESVFERGGVRGWTGGDAGRAIDSRAGRIPRRRPRSASAAATAARSCCRCSIRPAFARARKLFIGYSDLTSLLTFLTCQCGIVAFHGPMLDGPSRRGRERLRPATRSCACSLSRSRRASSRAEHVEALRTGRSARPAARRHADAAGGRRSARRTRSTPLGRHVLFLEDVGERPYRLDRLVHAAAAERRRCAHVRGSSSASCPAATSREARSRRATRSADAVRRLRRPGRLRISDPAHVRRRR